MGAWSLNHFSSGFFSKRFAVRDGVRNEDAGGEEVKTVWSKVSAFYVDFSYN